MAPVPALYFVLGVWPVPSKVVHEALGVPGCSWREQDPCPSALGRGPPHQRVLLPPLPHLPSPGNTVLREKLHPWALTAFPGPVS